MQYQITTGEQSISTTGPVTGVLGTSLLYAESYLIYVRVRGLPAQKRMSLVCEASANGTFSDALTAARWEFNGLTNPEGDTVSANSRDLTLVPFGTGTSAFRFNVTYLDSGGSAQIMGWLQQ